MDDFGLMFYNARWYDPVLGRFAQADTIIPDGVQGYDRYAYTNNNPVRYTDPSGHDPILGLLLLFATAALLTACDVAPTEVTPTNTQVAEQRLQQVTAIAEKYDITLPPGVEWAYHDQSDYPMSPQNVPIVPINDGSSPKDDIPEDFGDETLYDNNVYISNWPFDFGYSEIQTAGVMVHESSHAWLEYFIENGNPLNLPDTGAEYRIVTEAHAYTVQEIWLQQHGESLRYDQQDLADDYKRGFQGLQLNLSLPLPVPLPVNLDNP